MTSLYAILSILLYLVYIGYSLLMSYRNALFMAEERRRLILDEAHRRQPRTEEEMGIIAHVADCWYSRGYTRDRIVNFIRNVFNKAISEEQVTLMTELLGPIDPHARADIFHPSHVPWYVRDTVLTAWEEEGERNLTKLKERLRSLQHRLAIQEWIPLGRIEEFHILNILIYFRSPTYVPYGRLLSRGETTYHQRYMVSLTQEDVWELEEPYCQAIVPQSWDDSDWNDNEARLIGLSERARVNWMRFEAARRASIWARIQDFLCLDIPERDLPRSLVALFFIRWQDVWLLDPLVDSFRWIFVYILQWIFGGQ